MSRCQEVSGVTYLILGTYVGICMKIAVCVGVCGNWYVCLCPDYWMFCLCV